jgi:hypothetical protein
MRIIFALLLILTVVLSVSAFAAPAKKVATVSQSAQATGMRIGVGVENTPLGNYLGVPLAGLSIANVRFIGESFSGSAGLLFQSASTTGFSGSAMGLGGKFTFNLTGGAIPSHAGAALYYSSYSVMAAGSPTTSGFTIAAVYGAETIIADHLNIGVDIFPISISSLSIQNTNATISLISVLSGTVYASYLF